MRSKYKDERPIPDDEIAHIMIGMLMTDQHTSSFIAAWIFLRLAIRSDIQKEVYQKQKRMLSLTHRLAIYNDIEQLSLHKAVVRNTLRLHASIHSIMRTVKQPLTIETQCPGSSSTQIYSIPPSHVLISALGVTAQSTKYFTNPSEWESHQWENSKNFVDETNNANQGYGFVSKGSASYYLLFGARRHRCIEEQFAYLQLSIITAVLVREFVFRNPPSREGLMSTDYEFMFTKLIVPAYLE